MEYPHDYSAEYIFHNLDQDEFIQLYFIDFQLAPLSTMRVFDNTSELAVFTGKGRFRPPILTSSGPVLSIQFDANGQQFAPGFRVEYTFISYLDAFHIPKPTTECGGYKEDYGGIITLKGKEKMANVFDCIWLIRAPIFTTSSTYFSIKIAFFKDVDPGSVVEMRKGLSSESRLIKTINLIDGIIPEEFIFPAYDGVFVRFQVILAVQSKIVLTYSAFKNKKCTLYEEEFHCNNSRCISEALKCDGYDHCGDFSDEWYCADKMSTIKPGDKDVWIPKAKKLPSPGATNLILVVGIAGLGIFVSTTTMILTRLCKQQTRLLSDQEPLYTVSAEVDTEDSDDGHFESRDPPAYHPPPSYEEVMKQCAPPPYTSKNESNCYASTSQIGPSDSTSRDEVFSVVGLVQNWNRVVQPSNNSDSRNAESSLQTFSCYPNCKSEGNKDNSTQDLPPNLSCTPLNSNKLCMNDTNSEGSHEKNLVPTTSAELNKISVSNETSVLILLCKCEGACSCLSAASQVSPHG